MRSNIVTVLHVWTERITQILHAEPDHIIKRDPMMSQFGGTVIVFGEQHLHGVLRSSSSTTTAPEHTCRWPRMRPYPEPSRPSAAFFHCRSSAAYTTITSGSN